MVVFDEIDVTSTSVPIDAVLYNPPINHAYGPPVVYLVPDLEYIFLNAVDHALKTSFFEFLPHS